MVYSRAIIYRETQDDLAAQGKFTATGMEYCRKANFGVAASLIFFNMDYPHRLPHDPTQERALWSYPFHCAESDAMCSGLETQHVVEPHDSYLRIARLDPWCECWGVSCGITMVSSQRNGNNRTKNVQILDIQRADLTEDLCPLMSLLTYQSLPCEVSKRLTAIVFAPLAPANLVPSQHEQQEMV